MSVPFDVHQDVIFVSVRVMGPAGDFAAEFVLDTGASETVVSADVLTNIGYDLAKPLGRTRVTTASGTEIVPRLLVNQLEAPGQGRRLFSVLGLTLPTSADIHGLLGLDFIRGQELNINYRTGQITLG